MPRGVLVAVALLIAFASHGCVRRVRVQNQGCISWCQQRNDTCLIHATTAAAVQRCQQETTACVHQCG